MVGWRREAELAPFSLAAGVPRSQALHELGAAGNQLASLPPSIGELPTLKKLSLHGNQLRWVAQPSSMHTCMHAFKRHSATAAQPGGADTSPSARIVAADGWEGGCLAEAVLRHGFATLGCG